MATAAICNYIGSNIWRQNCFWTITIWRAFMTHCSGTDLQTKSPIFPCGKSGNTRRNILCWMQESRSHGQKVISSETETHLHLGDLYYYSEMTQFHYKQAIKRTKNSWGGFWLYCASLSIVLRMLLKKLIASIALPGGNITSELRDITCHIHSVTCHLTQVNEPRLTPAMQTGMVVPTPEGWKAELT